MPWLGNMATAAVGAIASAASAAGGLLSGAASSLLGSGAAGAGAGAGSLLAAETAVPAAMTPAAGGGAMSMGAPALGGAAGAGAGGGLGALKGIFSKATGVNLDQIAAPVSQGGGDWLGSYRGLEAGYGKSLPTSILQQIAQRDLNLSELAGAALRQAPGQAANTLRTGQSLYRGLYPTAPDGTQLSSESPGLLLQRVIQSILGQAHPGTLGYQSPN